MPQFGRRREAKVVRLADHRIGTRLGIDAEEEVERRRHALEAQDLRGEVGQVGIGIHRGELDVRLGQLLRDQRARGESDIVLLGDDRHVLETGGGDPLADRHVDQRHRGRVAEHLG